MSKRIQITGFVTVEDDEFDPDHPTLMIAEAYEVFIDSPLGEVEDLTFQVAP